MRKRIDAGLKISLRLTMYDALRRPVAPSGRFRLWRIPMLAHGGFWQWLSWNSVAGNGYRHYVALKEISSWECALRITGYAGPYTPAASVVFHAMWNL